MGLSVEKIRMSKSKLFKTTRIGYYLPHETQTFPMSAISLRNRDGGINRPEIGRPIHCQPAATYNQIFAMLTKQIDCQFVLIKVLASTGQI